MLHMGGVRTALFNFLFARGHGGVFVLRMEDTDTSRSRPEFERAIMEDLAWLGLTWDEGPDREDTPLGPYRQSERLGIYRKEAERLLGNGSAYWCTCSKERLAGLRAAQAREGLPPRYDGMCRQRTRKPGMPASIRFRVPDGRSIVFTDLLRGPRVFKTEALGDFIIMTPAGAPTYNLAAAVDDGLMKISDVIRGEDHLSNTPAQVLIMEALGFRVPRYAHLPLVLGPGRKPLGKRDRKTGINELRKEGYLPISILNAAARLGWAPGQGLMTLTEMASAFSFQTLSKSPSVFDPRALRDLNKKAMAQLSPSKLVKLAGLDLAPGGPARREEVVEALRSNASTLEDLRTLATPLLERPSPDPGAREVLKDHSAREVLAAFLDEIEKGTISYNELRTTVRKKTKASGKNLYMGLRAALTGMTRGIELEKIFNLLGPAEAACRIREALGKETDRERGS